LASLDRTLKISCGLIVIVVTLSNCFSKSIRFETDGAADVYKITGEKVAGQQGKYLGKTPITVKAEELLDSQLRFRNTADPSLPDQYWYFPELMSKDTKVILGWETGTGAVTANVNQQGKPGEVGSVEMNVFVRTLLRAYGEVAREKYREGLALAEKAVALNPSVAGPHLVVAIAKKGLGDVQGARDALVTAKGLDPQDADVEKMLKGLK